MISKGKEVIFIIEKLKILPLLKETVAFYQNSDFQKGFQNE